MIKDMLAIYLTYEFTSYFSPKMMHKPSSREIKLWLCPYTGMPVFSSADYGGPSSSMLIPTIGHPTIHIRPGSSKLSHSGATEHGLPDEIQLEILHGVFSQILKQINVLTPDINTTSKLQNAMQHKKVQIESLSKILSNIKVLNNERSLLH